MTDLNKNPRMTASERRIYFDSFAGACNKGVACPMARAYEAVERYRLAGKEVIKTLPDSEKWIQMWEDSKGDLGL